MHTQAIIRCTNRKKNSMLHSVCLTVAHIVEKSSPVASVDGG